MYQPQLSAVRTRAHARLASLFIASALLSACATQSTESPRAAISLESIARDAEAELAKGNREQAVALLTQGARNYPTSPAPWLRMATIWFEAANYPSAILAANEALQRDAASQEAKSLLVVGGLRVAAGAVAGLRPTAGIGMNARSEAENLTASLRSAIGEKSLVPVSSGEARVPSVSARPRGKIVRPAASSKDSAGNGADTNPRGAAAASADPFKSLK